MHLDKPSYLLEIATINLQQKCSDQHYFSQKRKRGKPTQSLLGAEKVQPKESKSSQKKIAACDKWNRSNKI